MLLLFWAFISSVRLKQLWILSAAIAKAIETIPKTFSSFLKAITKLVCITAFFNAHKDFVCDQVNGVFDWESLVRKCKNKIEQRLRWDKSDTSNWAAGHVFSKWHLQLICLTCLQQATPPTELLDMSSASNTSNWAAGHVFSKQHLQVSCWTEVRRSGLSKRSGLKHLVIPPNNNWNVKSK